MYAPTIIYKSVFADSDGYDAQRKEVYNIAVNLAKEKGLKDYHIALYKAYGSRWNIEIS